MIKDFQKMNSEELQKTLKEKREEILNNRFSLSGGKTKKAAESKILRRQIAQILTIVNTTK